LIFKEKHVNKTDKERLFSQKEGSVSERSSSKLHPKQTDISAEKVHSCHCLLLLPSCPFLILLDCPFQPEGSVKEKNRALREMDINDFEGGRHPFQRRERFLKGRKILRKGPRNISSKGQSSQE
jgi:hypothetical protein